MSPDRLQIGLMPSGSHLDTESSVWIGWLPSSGDSFYSVPLAEVWRGQISSVTPAATSQSDQSR